MFSLNLTIALYWLAPVDTTFRTVTSSFFSATGLISSPTGTAVGTETLKPKLS
ncbi:hypothetical protein D3C75_1342380 [compost metagenome]